MRCARAAQPDMRSNAGHCVHLRPQHAKRGTSAVLDTPAASAAALTAALVAACCAACSAAPAEVELVSSPAGRANEEEDAPAGDEAAVSVAGCVWYVQCVQ